MTISATPLSRHIGTEIRGVDLSRPLAPEVQKELYAQWLKHLVLLFRDQKLGQADLLRVTRSISPPASRTCWTGSC
jgi:taurine dioxygenase